MAIEHAVLGTGLDVSFNPKKILAQAATRAAINVFVKNTGGNSMFWGDDMQGVVRQAFDMVSQSIWAIAVLASNGKTQEQVKEIAVDKAFGDANFVRAAQKASMTPDGGSDPALVRMAEAIVMELANSGEVGEEGTIIQEAVADIAAIPNELEQLAKGLQALPSNIADLPEELAEGAKRLYNEYGELITESVDDVKEALDIPKHLRDAIDAGGHYLDNLNKVDIPATILNAIDELVTPIIAAPGDFADSITDFVGGEVDNVVDRIYLRNASRGR